MGFNKFLSLGLIVAASSFTLAQSQQFAFSNTLGNHMVLQRDVSTAMVWGSAAPGMTVYTTFNGQKYTTSADATGVWRQYLPSTPAGGPYTITSTCSQGSLTLTDVLFGDVYLCGGQSNMEFAVDNGFNATEEVAAAANYPTIRVFTVGSGTSSNVSLSNLTTITQPWAVASPASIGVANWTAFSAVCWFFGRNVQQALGGGVPLGLISNNWGGTPVQAWSSPDALAKCPQSTTAGREHADAGPNSHDPSVLWNAMIAPYTIGPMALKGFTWFQGEANVGGAAYYACQFPAMIADWRAKLGVPQAWFGFVQLEPWIAGTGVSLAQFRDAQLNATSLPSVHFATAIDIGDPTSPFGSVHPRHKQIVGARLAASALAEVYGMPSVPHTSPQYASASPLVSGTQLTVTVSLAGSAGPLTLVNAACPIGLGVPADQCAYPTIYTAQGPAGGYNATLSLSTDGLSVVLSGTAGSSGESITGTAYGYGTWPVVTVYAGDCWAAPAVAQPICYPVLTWMRNITSSEAA